MVYVKAKDGTPLSPTENYAKVRVLLGTLSQKYYYSGRTANISVNRQFSVLNPE